MHSKWLQSLQDHYVMKPVTMEFNAEMSAMIRWLSLLAPNRTWTLANKVLVYLGPLPPTDALLICQCVPVTVLLAALHTWGAEVSQECAVYRADPSHAAVEALLPPSPHRGAPPPRRAQSCGYHSEALPVNKINQGKHLGKKKNPNKTKTTRTSWSLHLQFLQQRERHRSDESFQATI